MSEDKLVSDHAYDDIKEYDNPLPLWWLGTFAITIIFSAIYYFHYEFGSGVTLKDELKIDMAEIEKLNPPKTPGSPQESEDDLKALLAQNEVVATGQKIYTDKCAACHGPQLQGLIGPNLVDEYWIHGKGTLSDIIAVVRGGVLDKGMPNWDSLLKDTEIKAVTVFVATKFGTTPPNPKPPQGEKVVHN